MDTSLFTSIFSEDRSLEDESITLSSGKSATLSELATLSTRELLNEFRKSKNAEQKQILLDLIQEKNPHISHLGKVYTVDQPAQLLRSLPSTDIQDNIFVPLPSVLGKNFALLPAILPKGATLKILADDQHFQKGRPLVAVAQVKIVGVIAEEDKKLIGKTTWTTRSNVSAKADAKGLFKIIKPSANFRDEPTLVPGRTQLPIGLKVYIDVVKIDSFIQRRTYGFAVDATTHEEYGWIRTTALVGKMDIESFAFRIAPYDSIEANHQTVGGQSALALERAGLYFAVQKETFVQHTKVKIVNKAEHFGAKGKAKVAEIHSVDGIHLGWTTLGNLSVQPDQNGFHEITANDANVRSAPLPIYKATMQGIRQGAKVEIQEIFAGFLWVKDEQPQEITISKIAENVWIDSANLVKGWADFKGPNARWLRGNYIGQTAILDVIGGIEANGKQIAMDDGLGEKIEQMLRDVRAEKIPLTINSGFRDFKKQEQLRRDQPDNAAVAGRSEHQAGKSVDLNNKSNAKVYEWMRHNAWKYSLVQTYPWFVGTDGSGGEGHHWDYRPNLAKEGFYTYFINRFDPGVTFGEGEGEIDPRVKSTETWLTGNAKGFGKGNFRIVETATGKSVQLRKN